MKSRIMIIIIVVVICQLLPAFDEKETKEQIKELKAMIQNWGRADKIYSEEDLEKAILFVNDPIKYFHLIPALNSRQLWSHIWTYDRFMYESKRTSTGFFFERRLRAVTETMDDEKVYLMTFLLLNCVSPVYGELIADLYTILFEKYPELFIKNLKRRKDWKRTVDELYSGNWERFKAGLDKLGNSKFEKEFKEYALAPRDEKGKIIKKISQH